MAYILALIVGLGSVGLYMAAFFFPEVYRKNDFVLSGLGMFYALVLWVCAGRMTGGVLLGQVASVTLLGWLSWQGLEMRRSLTPVDQQTRLPGAARTLGDVLRQLAQKLPGQLQQQVNRLPLPAALGGLAKQTTRSIGSAPLRSPKRLTKQLQDGDRLKPTAQQSEVGQPAVSKSSGQPSSVKSTKKRPIKQVAPPDVDAIAPLPQAPVPQTTAPQAPAPDAQMAVPPAIAPLPADAAPPVNLPVPPAIASDPLLDVPSTDSIAAPSPQFEPEPLTISTANVPTTALDNDFGFDDELIPTRATAAELRELTIQSAASRRPNWFITLKQRLQRGRNVGKRSPQSISPPTSSPSSPPSSPPNSPPSSPSTSASDPKAGSLSTSPLDPVVSAVEGAPETNLETNLNPNLDPALDPNPATETVQKTGQSISQAVLQHDIQEAEVNSIGVVQPDISSDLQNDPRFTAEILEAVEAIAATVEVETLMASPEEDWDLGWMEESEPSESAATDEFEGAAFSAPDSSVTITVEAETIPTLETDAAPDAAFDRPAEAEWDLGWAGEVLAADSAAEAVMNSEMAAVTDSDMDSEMDSEMDSGMDSEMDSGVESRAEFLEQSRSNDWANADADADADADAPQATWDTWEEANLDESASALPLFIEEDVELLSTESSWLDAEIITPSPNLLELLEEDIETIGALRRQANAFPNEDFSDLLSSPAAPEPVDDSDAIAPVEQIEPLAQLSEGIAPPFDPDESLIVIDESLILSDESLILSDDSLIVVDETQSVSNESLILPDETQSVSNESLILTDETQSVVDESLILTDESLILPDETQSVVDESLVLTDESQSVVDKSLILTDESLILTDESLILTDESLIVVDESLIVADESLIVVDESLILPDETQSVLNESLILVDETQWVVDESLSEEFGLTEPEIEPETAFREQTSFDEDEARESAEHVGRAIDTDPKASAVVEIPSQPTDDASTSLPIRSTGRGLTIQIVKIEASDAGSEPTSDSDSEEP